MFSSTVVGNIFKLNQFSMHELAMHQYISYNTSLQVLCVLSIKFQLKIYCCMLIIGNKLLLMDMKCVRQTQL
jgi:hypothetical protein